MIKVLSFLSTENCFADHSRGLAGHGLSTNALNHQHGCDPSETDFSKVSFSWPSIFGG